MTRQTLDLPLAEVRFAADEEAGEIEGYASVFGELIPSYREVVARGAFTKSLAAHAAAGTRPPMLWAHSDDVIGVWTEIKEDARGLKVKGKIVRETQRGQEAFALLKAGAVSGLSIGFNTRESSRDKAGNRLLEEIDLAEISIVPVPAAPNARISNVRSDRARATADFITAVKSATRALRKDK